MSDPTPQTPLADEVTTLIVEQLGVAREEAVASASFIDDLGADSLDIVELVMSMEETFEVEISDEDAEGLRTIGDAVQFIQAQRG